jgi:hypothetical protein
MADEPIYISDEQDMAAYDALPAVLKKYLDGAQVGLQATPVLEYYREKLEKLTPLYSEHEVQQMMVRTLDEYQKRNGVVDFRKLILRPGVRHRKQRVIRPPKFLLKEMSDGCCC